MASVSKRKWTYNGVAREAWVVRYVDKGGRHRSRQFDKKKPADEYKREVENEIEAGAHVPRRESRTISDTIDEYLADITRRAREGKVSERYFTTAYGNLTHARTHLGKILVRDLTWQEVEKYYHAMGQQTSIFGRGFSQTTIVNYLSQLGTMMGYAVRRGYAARNVVADAKREIGPQAPDVIDTFTKDEIRALLTVLEVYEKSRQERIRLQIRAMVYLAVACGLRKGEIAALTWEAIDFDHGTVKVLQALTPLDTLKPPKTKSSYRTVPLPAPVMAALIEYRPHVVTDSRGLIFRSRRGGDVMVKNLYRMWHHVLDKAGLRTRHFHALRHFAGSSWLAAGLPLPEVSRLLGHANSFVTAQIYSHVVSESNYRPAQVASALADVAPSPTLLIAQELRKAA